MNNKFLDLGGLNFLVEKFKSIFAQIIHKHTLSDIEDYTVDSALSSTSVNPIQNKTVNEALVAFSTDIDNIEASIDRLTDEKANIVHNHDDQYYTESEVDALIDSVADRAAEDSKFLIMVFDYNNTTKRYESQTTLDEAFAMLAAGRNIIANVDTTDYIPLLSAVDNADLSRRHFIFSGIYNTNSVSFDVYQDENGVSYGILKPNSLLLSSGTAAAARNDGNGNNIVNTYETKANANSKYSEIEIDINNITANMDALSDIVGEGYEAISNEEIDSLFD